MFSPAPLLSLDLSLTASSFLAVVPFLLLPLALTLSVLKCDFYFSISLPSNYSLPLLPIYSFHLILAPTPTTPSSSSHFFSTNRFVLSCLLSTCIKGSGCSLSESFSVWSLNKVALEEFSFNILVSWQLSVCVLLWSIHFVPVAVFCRQ